jgi:nicotinamide-nucleotide amidase
MELILGRWFTVKDKTLALAESCTGGGLASQMTSIHGSSRYFLGSIVSYSAEAKQQLLGVKKETLDKEGMVSEQTVIEMVKGALHALNSDYALAVTGLLSSGGESDRVEVGTVWMAVADKDNIKTKKFQFQYDRLRNKEMALSMAMLMIWKFINSKPL